jgi:hypothetical protein
LTLSPFARWQQVLVMLFYVMYESKISPLRGRRRRGIAVTVLGFTIAYGLIYRLAPFVFAALLAQAEAGHTILILDNIQAYFGFPLVVILEIMMNCIGYFVSPGYFLNSYTMRTLRTGAIKFSCRCTPFLTALLAGMLYGRKLRLKHAPMYLLALYLLMTAVETETPGGRIADETTMPASAKISLFKLISDASRNGLIIIRSRNVARSTSGMLRSRIREKMRRRQLETATLSLY